MTENIYWWRNRTLKEIIDEAVQKTLKDCGNSKAEAAKRLGVAEKTIYNRLEKMGLNHDVHVD